MARPEPEIPEDQLAALRQDILTAALRQMPGLRDAAEDVTQDALLKVMSERVGPESPPVKVRALRAMKDKRAEHFRREQKYDLHNPSELQATIEADGFAEDSAIAVITYMEALRRHLDPEAFDFFEMYKIRGLPAAEIAKLPGWDKKRVARVCRRVDRTLPVISKELQEIERGSS
jgi:DNA-directed RNA polymerase specialized sigma24 family protein